MKLPSEQAIFLFDLFVDGIISGFNAFGNELYHQHKDEDGFLYVGLLIPVIDILD